jgi:hypothetical protein
MSILQEVPMSEDASPTATWEAAFPTRPWESIGMDFIGLFVETKGMNYLWVIICRLTSMVHLIPVHTSVTAKELS